MAEWAATAATAGQWVLIVASGTFFVTAMALVIHALRRGEVDDGSVAPSMRLFGARRPLRRSGLGAYYGRAKLFATAQRRLFVPMESLVNGTATREQWAVVVGIQVLLVSFWGVFLGIGLLYLPGSNGFSLFFPGVTGLWLFKILRSQWNDVVAGRRKVGRSETP